MNRLIGAISFFGCYIFLLTNTSKSISSLTLDLGFFSFSTHHHLLPDHPISIRWEWVVRKQVMVS